MSISKKKLANSLFFSVFISAFSSVFAQQINLPLNNDVNSRVEPYLNRVGTNFHTSIKPYLASEVNDVIKLDSVKNSFYSNDESRFKKTLLYRKLRKEDLITVDKPDFKLAINPLVDFEGGYERTDKKKYYVNTRGAMISGSIQKLYFNSTFYENQATYPTYLSDYVKRHDVVPGQGVVKTFKSGGYDFSNASGYISYSLNQYFNIQFGHDKNFIGDGYRSLLLSDNSFNYPFLKINTNIWKLKYTILYTQLQDISLPHSYTLGYRKKYGAFHYLDLAIGKRINVGLFEAVVWQGADSTGERGFDVNYLNPIIFYRPVEFSVGSPDNEMLGMNASIKISNTINLYGQIMLDEFYLGHLRKHDGWYANKYGFQAGFKAFDIFKIKNLSAQSEFNYVRPFAYSHFETLSNYGHYNQPLAHPFGANFYESVSFIRYRYQSFYANLEVLYALRGLDDPSDPTHSYGTDIYKSYRTYANEYGNFVGQGVSGKLSYADLRIGYVVNPSYNLCVELGYMHRTETSGLSPEKTDYISFGIRTSLRNHYYDF